MKAKLFTATSNTSCRKAIAWLNEYNIPYVEKNISTTPITIEEIQEILSLTNEGTEEIISKKAYAIKKLKLDFDSLSMPQLYQVIQDNPGVLRLPILHDGKKLQVGYNDDEIRQFLPRWFRTNQFQTLLGM
ncbi:transcriptional regulator Spx [Planomicrobium chinense]|uniref:Transcriptional regulator Spx n=1 Tax=Planococcus liqunii TaxID=3058394 RepID=A0ABT8MQH7_9BACL|nr:MULTISPECIES: transcriptional regulator Spx [Planococcus]MBZ5201183.1 transcriptional regulator Spx [Planococcus chinensis]MCP2035102.1 regulatory protein spx [Planomicrobium sp. HSC-17F08]MDN7226994.1 transcriptional regulator Spx [Planococcus sp. N064]WKA52417.1 transcriptional regulator Spx [Planococcus sp. N056]